jgi:hypothetical protein
VDPTAGGATAAAAEMMSAAGMLGPPEKKHVTLVAEPYSPSTSPPTAEIGEATVNVAMPLAGRGLGRVSLSNPTIL